MAKWIIVNANLPTATEKIKTGTSLPSPTRDDPLWISSRRHPDVAWYEGEVVLQIEVVSSYSTQKTVNKLCLGLIDQLRSWKNRLSSVSSIKGFVFPISNDSRSVEECGQCVKLVELCWKDVAFQYKATVTALNAMEVWNSLRRVHAEQLHQLNSLRSRTNNHFTLPLTDRYIKDTFTISLEQVKSGESVVILNDTYTYKRPLGARAMARLLELLVHRPQFETYTAGALPQLPAGQVHVPTPFFEFKKYFPPPTVQEIRRQNRKYRFVKAVIRSLQVLHNTIGIAHLDVRIENICWDDAQRAVFIDFDRSAKMDTLASDCVGTMYGDSLMYPTTDVWTERAAWNVDFRQIAIMIGHIEGNNNPHSTPPGLAHPFMQKLYNEGKFTRCVWIEIISTPYVQVNIIQIYMNNGI